MILNAVKSSLTHGKKARMIKSEKSYISQLTIHLIRHNRYMMIYWTSQIMDQWRNFPWVICFYPP